MDFKLIARQKDELETCQTSPEVQKKNPLKAHVFPSERDTFFRQRLSARAKIKFQLHLWSHHWVKTAEDDRPKISERYKDA